MLHEVNDDPDSRFCALKKRFRDHFELLRKEKGFGGEVVQHMIDILGTYGNYEEMLARVVAGNTKGPRFTSRHPWSKDLVYHPPLNGYKLDSVDDTTFLTEISTIIMEKPAYRQIVEEILQEATKSLGIKLNKLKKELISLVRVQVAHIVKQETNERVDSEKRNTDQAAKARLRSLIREALDAETDHPTSR